MTSKNRRVLIVDGFAGPGEYQGGQDGSPVIAMRALCDHSARSSIRNEVRFLFIEGDEKRATHLDRIVKGFERSLPRNASARVLPGRFDERMTAALDQLDVNSQRLAPSFVMIDPFGVSDTPMRVIQRILANPKAEVYISFMYEAMNRFKDTDEFRPHLDGLFGCDTWQEGIDIEEGEKRKDFFYSLYESQLRAAGAKHVVRFELYDERRLVYAIFFATGYWKGADKMKEAIWRIDPFGRFRFRGTRHAELELRPASPDVRPLRRALLDEFALRGFVGIEEVQEFVGSDRTDFYLGQLKTHCLRGMEEDGALEVDPKSRKRTKTYPDGTRIRFVRTLFDP